MIKTFNVFWQIFKINIKKSLIYRVNFVITLVAMTLWVGIYIAFFEVIFSHIDTLAGWDKGQVLTILGFYYISQSLGAIFYRDSFEAFGEEMRRGQLDQLITKPVSIQLLSFFKNIRIDHFFDLLFTAAIFIYAAVFTNVVFTPLLFFFGLLAALVSQLLFYGLLLMIASMVFFADRLDSLHSFIWHLTQISRYPRQIYTGVVGFILQFIFPVALTASIPAEIVLQSSSWSLIGLFTAISLASLLIGNLIFRLGLNNYQSAN